MNRIDEATIIYAALQYVPELVKTAHDNALKSRASNEVYYQMLFTGACVSLSDRRVIHPPAALAAVELIKTLSLWIGDIDNSRANEAINESIKTFNKHTGSRLELLLNDTLLKNDAPLKDDLRNIDFQHWLKDCEPNIDCMTWGDIHGALVVRGRHLWMADFDGWRTRQTIIKKKPGRPKKL